MNDIIITINDKDELQDNIQVFSHLSKEIKLETLEKLKNERTEIFGQFLNKVYASEHDKQVQKALKKLLFRLKTVGVKVEEFRVEGESVLKKFEEKRDHHGLISNYDGDGSRMVMVAFHAKGNAYVLIHGLLHFSNGLLELANTPVDREGLYHIIAEYLKGSLKPFTIVEVAPRYANYLFEEASSLSGRYIEEIKQIKSLSSRLGGQVQKPVDIYSLAMPDSTGALSLERVLASELFEPFSVTWDTIEEDRKHYNDRGSSSTIVLPPYMVEEKKQELLKNLIENGKLSPNLPLMKRLIEDYAYILHVQGKFNAYKGLIEILHQSDGVYKSLSFFVKKALEQTQEQHSGLIVNPYEQVRTPR